MIDINKETGNYDFLKNNYHLSEDNFATSKNNSRNGSSRNYYTPSFGEQRPHFSGLVEQRKRRFQQTAMSAWNVDATTNNKNSANDENAISNHQTSIATRITRIVDIMVMMMMTTEF
jgi:hypothetical protein